MIKNFKIFEKYIQFFIVLMATIFVPALLYSAEIIIKPAPFDHFNIEVPSKVVAGEAVNVKLQAVDIFNNIIEKFSNTNDAFQLTILSSLGKKSINFKSKTFVDGVINVQMVHNIAENITLQIFNINDSIPVLSQEISVLPNKINSFQIKTPKIAIAGEIIPVKIIMMDTYNNMILDTFSGRNLQVTFKGENEPRIVDTEIADFKDGVNTIRVTANKSGTFEVEIKDLATGNAGISEKIKVTNALLDAFIIVSPKDIVAGRYSCGR